MAGRGGREKLTRWVEAVVHMNVGVFKSAVVDIVVAPDSVMLETVAVLDVVEDTLVALESPRLDIDVMLECVAEVTEVVLDRIVMDSHLATDSVMVDAVATLDTVVLNAGVVAVEIAPLSVVAPLARESLAELAGESAK